MAKNVGPMIDKLFAAKTLKEKAESKAKKLRDEYNEMKDKVRAELVKQELDGANGVKARVSLIHRTVAVISEYNKFEKFVYKNKALHLLTKTPSTVAWRELLEERKGRPIPGMSSFQKIDLRVTKRR